MTQSDKNGWSSKMFALITFITFVVLLIAAIGLPYRQSWYGRWTGDGR